MWNVAVWALMSAVILMSSCSTKKPGGENQTGLSPNAYKHANADCVDCHGIENPLASAPAFEQRNDFNGACLGCHDYKQNHHPVDIAPTLPTGIPFPLFDGKIRCLTCHEIHGGHERQGTKKLLVGGPYRDRREICFQCHAPEQYTSLNPHNMLDANNKIRVVNGKAVCLVCHSKQPDPARDTTEDVLFRADIGFLCWRCHPPMPGEFFTAHFLKVPSAKTLKNMLASEEEYAVILPIVPRGRITCSTCHNPHQEGVIQREAAAKGADRKFKLRLPDICYACHLI